MSAVIDDLLTADTTKREALKQARAHRIQAETEVFNHFFTIEERARRVAHFNALADQYEAIAKG